MLRADEESPVLLLLEDEQECARLFGELKFNQQGFNKVEVLVPPIRGMAFFALEQSAELDEFWETMDLVAKRPQYLIEHTAGLSDLIANVDGDIYVWYREPDGSDDYTKIDNVRVIFARNLNEFMVGIGFQDLDDDEEEEEEEDDVDDGDDDDEQMTETLMELIKSRMEAEANEKRGGRGGRGAPMGGEGTERWKPQLHSGNWDATEEETEAGPVKKQVMVEYLEPTAPSPYELLSSAPPLVLQIRDLEGMKEEEGPVESDTGMENRVYEKKPISTSSGAKKGRGGALLAWRLPFLGGSGSSLKAPDLMELRRLVLRNRPVTISFGSVRGGPGKTTTAAGVAVVAGRVCDLAGGRAGLVDGNLANPDAWNAFGIPDGAPRIRTLCDNLIEGKLPPGDTLLQSDRSPGLVVWPESREGVEYGEEDIEILSKYFRTSNLITLVDLTNRLPSMTTSPEAAVAEFWIRRSSILVLPMRIHPTDMEGVRQYLKVPELPPVVVTYLSPRNKATMNRATTKSFFEEIKRKVAGIIEVPDDPRVEQAAFEGQNIEEISPTLGRIYMEILQSCLQILDQNRGRNA